MNGCKVTLIPQKLREQMKTPCGQPVVNVDHQTCVKHEADRLRLGVRP